MIEQKVISLNGDYSKMASFLDALLLKRVFVVCGNSIKNFKIEKLLIEYTQRGIDIFYFKDFTPNPEYEQIMTGMKHFKEGGYNLIIAIGGGSNIDTAKAIKFYSESNVPLLAMPTTAGSGAEATRFAVIYEGDEKKSVGNDNTIPNYVFIDPYVLKFLPLYHKKSCMLDALCHCIESIWSVNATENSIKFAKIALEIIIENYIDYIAEKEYTFQKMLEASYYAGKAINISKTTAAHAMAYIITKKYNIAHGHAVAICMKVLLPYIIEVAIKDEDFPKERLNASLKILSNIFCVNNYQDIVQVYNNIFTETNLEVPSIKKGNLEMLVESVNMERLANTPVILGKDEIYNLYKGIVKEQHFAN